MKLKTKHWLQGVGLVLAIIACLLLVVLSVCLGIAELYAKVHFVLKYW